MQKVLFVVSRPIEINTSASVRNKAMIEGLLENGYTVDLFSSEPDINHPAYDSSLAVAGCSTNYVHLGGIQNVARIGRRFKFLRSLKSFIYHWMSRNEIYDNLKGIVAQIDTINLREIHYDWIISSSDPKSSHLFVKKLLDGQPDVFKGKWIQIWGDPFLGDITLSTKRLAKRIEAEEDRLLSAADLVVYVSKLTLDEQRRLYPQNSDKMIYSPIPYVKEHNYHLRDIGAVKPVELVYCGDYDSSVRNIRPLYQAINSMDGVHLTVCGGSNVPLESTEKVTVHGRVSYQKVLELEEKGDILIHLSNLSGSQIPGKVYQYSGTNKPILFVLDGDSQKIRKQFGLYSRFEFAENEVQKIQQKVSEIIRSNREYSPLDAFSKKTVMETLMQEVTKLD